MKILIIKMSSMGDIIHTFTALTAAVQACPGLRADWVVEEGFAALPTWHPAVDRVIPIALRRWRRSPFKALLSGEWACFYRQLRHCRYDLVIDAQGLIKSGLICRLSRGKRVGLDKASLWEPLARWCYQQHYAVSPQQHAIVRVNALFAQALGYTTRDTVDYGLTADRLINHADVTLPIQLKSSSRYLLFLHGTTWQTKLWPDQHWLTLAQYAKQAGYVVYVTWGNEVEQQRSRWLAQQCDAVTVLDRMGLTTVAAVIARAQAIVAVDTGLGHLAAALAVPTVSLYGPTQSEAIGTMGNRQCHLQASQRCEARCNRQHCARDPAHAACLNALHPDQVWQHLMRLIRP